MSADVAPRRAYEPPRLHTIGALRSVTMDDDRHRGYDGGDLAKRWSRHGDYWHWYRRHGGDDDDDRVRGRSLFS